MNNIDYTQEFKKIEKKIVENRQQNKDVTGLLRSKAKILEICYFQLADSMKSGKVANIAPNFAKALSFLNNIKAIKDEINDDTSSTVSEIETIHMQMRELGLGWILDNMPKKQS